MKCSRNEFFEKQRGYTDVVFLCKPEFGKLNISIDMGISCTAVPLRELGDGLADEGEGNARQAQASF